MTLEINRIDSPLLRSPDPPPEPSAQTSAPPGASPASDAPRPSRARARPKAALTSVPAREPADQAEEPTTPVEPTPAAPLAPPALAEPLELLSTRLPGSLRRNISEMTAALRARQGGRASQKSLPEQEVLAVMIWLAGSPQDPHAVERLGRALDSYRAQRYAAEARALSS